MGCVTLLSGILGLALLFSGHIKIVVSVFIGAFLRVAYPLPHYAGQKPLPTAPFTWPNGQGTEKFFDGRRAAARWRAEFGPIYRIWSGLKQEIVLSKPEHVQVFFRDSHKHRKAMDNNSGWLFGELLGECVGLVSLGRWRNLRQHVDPSFTRGAANSYTGAIIAQAHRFIDELPVRGDQTISPVDDLKYCPFFMVASIFFGDLSEQQREALCELAPLREELFKDSFKGGVNRYALGRYVPGSGAGRLRTFQRKWVSFVEQAYHRAKNEGLAAPIVFMWESVREGRISMTENLQTLDESLYANLDVTAHAVSWNQILLAQHPAVQDQLRDEMEASIDRQDSVSYERYINSDDTLLAACILEAARLRPILPFSNPESATEDKTVEGYLIPRNTDVIVDAYAINVENPFWVDGTQYNPFRHMALRKEQIRYNMWRFGFGPRQCLGKNVVERILRAITAELVVSHTLAVPKNTSRQDVGVQNESWVGLPDTRILVSRDGFLPS